jgi:hypothetical protein
VAPRASRTPALQKDSHGSCVLQSPLRAPAHPRIRLQEALGNRGVEGMLKARLPSWPQIGLRDDQATACAGKVPDLMPERDRRIPDPGNGRPLDPATRVQMEARFGHGFRHVRVHTDGPAASAAARWSARALTLDHDIHFGAAYESSSPAGEALLAHELTHVVQADAAATNPGRPSSPINALESEARQVTAAFRDAHALPQVRGLARSLSAPLRQGPGKDDPGMPTFGNLSGRQPAEGRIELRRIGDTWYEIRPGLRGRVLATHRYHYAVQDGRIWASRYGHVEAARGQRVTFAGDIRFTEDGALINWDNASGSFKPASHFATQTGLPLDKFVDVPGPKKQLQLAVFQPKPGEILVPAGGRGGAPGLGPRGEPSPASGGGGLQAAPPTTVTPTTTAPAAAVAQGGLKPPVVAPREMAAELARTLREVRRLEFAARAVRYGLGAYQAVNALRDIAKSVNMATATLAQGSPYAAQIQHADTVESTAKEIARYYGAFDLRDQRIPEQDPSWSSYYDVYQFQLTFLLMEQSFHEALKEVQAARDNVENQMELVRDEMAAKTAALIFATTSVVHAEVMLFADAGGKINTRLQAAGRYYRMAENALRYHIGMTRALAQWHEMRLRELGSSGVFSDIASDKLRSTSLDKFTFRR